MPIDPGSIKQALLSERWAGLLRLDLAPETIATWDPNLLRQSRVLVPVNVQALYVPAGDSTLYVHLPSALTTPDGKPPESVPAPMAAGIKRNSGVYLHWAPPDALLRGALQNVPDGSANRLGMPALPDRWVVIRILAPVNAAAPVVTGWVVEADTTKVVPLDQWPAASATTAPTGKTVAAADLAGTIGGALNWTSTFDAGVNRFGIYDSLADVPTLAPAGVVNDLASYLVAGWWSDPQLDPLDSANTAASLAVRLAELGWYLMSDSEGGDQVNQQRDALAANRATLTLKTGTRFPAPALDPAIPTQPFAPQASRFVTDAAAVIGINPRWPRSTLLHGVVFGVPVKGPVVADQMPAAQSVDLALGRTSDDVAAALASSGMGITAAADRRNVERLLSAFTGQVLAEFGTPDGIVDTEEHEHESGFGSRPGGPGTVERLRKGAESGPLNAGRQARSQAARVNAAAALKGATKIAFAATRTDLQPATVQQQRGAMASFTGTPPETDPTVEVREVVRPAPRYFAPLDPVLAIRGAKRSLRHILTGRFSHDGSLFCRWPSQVVTSAPGLLDGADYVPSLPSGAIPDEVLTLVRGAVISDPYLVPWLAANESKRRQTPPAPTLQRLSAEAAMRFGQNAVYDGATNALQPPPSASAPPPSFLARAQIADQLRRFSLFTGVDANPVSVTAWSQPWIPMWLEWEMEFRTTARLDAWSLAQLDFDSAPAPVPPPLVFRGRSPLHAGTARSLAASIDEWLKTEEARDVSNQGEADPATAASLHHIAENIGLLDIVTATLDGLNQQLLGLPVGPFGITVARQGAGLRPPVPVAAPQLLAGGALRLRRARIVDAFGRTLDLPPAGLHVAARDEIAGNPPAVNMRPRLLRPARWLFRLVDPAIADGPGGATPAEANIDQIDPTKMINPVAGFLLPDHIDEALEVFDTAGQPLGQLETEPIGGGATWEIAPGRPGPSDAGPGFALADRQRILGMMAAGMVAADARARGGKPAAADDESALSAFLRAIDTTLWTVDTFAQLGNEHIAGLVGRPVAVVRATLRLDLDDDLDELDLSNPAKRAQREAAYRALADRAFPVRLGELTRSDDGLLGFFVNDDYARFHVVDKVVRDAALDSGPGRGQLDQLGSTSQLPATRPITHPYIVAEDQLTVHLGETVTLTLLLYPAARVHLTSGILPRKYLQLAREWVEPGLAVMAPSARIGPVLIDADQVRLPKISSFPGNQIWTRRDTPATWKDDPILAATQTALLPALPAQVQEGYIRIGPLDGGGNE
jgi:hypothetical protein